MDSRTCRDMRTCSGADCGDAPFPRPDKLMIVFEDREWTYQQAWSMAGSLVEHIVGLGLRPENGPIAVELSASDFWFRVANIGTLTPTETPE